MKYVYIKKKTLNVEIYFIICFFFSCLYIKVNSNDNIGEKLVRNKSATIFKGPKKQMINVF